MEIWFERERKKEGKKIEESWDYFPTQRIFPVFQNKMSDRIRREGGKRGPGEEKTFLICERINEYFKRDFILENS